MSMKTYDDASTFLGDGTGRYFANGYRHFHWRITAFEVSEAGLGGELEISYDGPARPDGQPHLGSIEYTAIASMLAEYVLIYLARLDAEQVSLSLLRHIRLKLRDAVEVAGETTLPFRCALGQPDWTRRASNGILSPIAVWLADTHISLVADHPANRWGRFDPCAVWPLNRPAMYNHGYKLRTNTVADVCCDATNRTCSAMVTRDDYYGGDRQGLFSARSATIPTDVLTVTGQLMQVLLYTLEGTTREDCGNIWLRAMDIRYGRAMWAKRYAASVRFLDVKTLAKGEHRWRAVRLVSQLAGITGEFSITHRLKTN
ncbi:MAG: hypothetical protein EAS52_15670 [Parapedobacter sp.]|nr:MAG: hypothetical protein EAS52_15670 [Parapedobacter sp.]